MLSCEATTAYLVELVLGGVRAARSDPAWQGSDRGPHFAPGPMKIVHPEIAAHCYIRPKLRQCYRAPQPSPLSVGTSERYQPCLAARGPSTAQPADAGVGVGPADADRDGGLSGLVGGAAALGRGADGGVDPAAQTGRPGRIGRAVQAADRESTCRDQDPGPQRRERRFAGRCAAGRARLRSVAAGPAGRASRPAGPAPCRRARPRPGCRSRRSLGRRTGWPTVPQLEAPGQDTAAPERSGWRMRGQPARCDRLRRRPPDLSPLPTRLGRTSAHRVALPPGHVNGDAGPARRAWGGMPADGRCLQRFGPGSARGRRCGRSPGRRSRPSVPAAGRSPAPSGRLPGHGRPPPARRRPGAGASAVREPAGRRRSGRRSGVHAAAEYRCLR